MASNSKKKLPTTSSDGNESRRWRESTAAPRDAEIALEDLGHVFYVHISGGGLGVAPLLPAAHLFGALLAEGYYFVAFFFWD